MDFFFSCEECGYTFSVTTNHYSDYFMDNHEKLIRCPHCEKPNPKLESARKTLILTKSQVETLNKLRGTRSLSEYILEMLERTYEK